jgi:endoglucanase
MIPPFFSQLLETPSPSGFEEAARAVWRDYTQPIRHEQHTDVHGTEIATVRGKAERTSFLLLGHIDEIGLIIRYIDDAGFLYFEPVGGQDPEVIISQQVTLLGPGGLVRGVIGKVAPHMQDEEARNRKTKIFELYVDVGARTRDEAAALAPVGTAGTIGGGVLELTNGRFAARCIDNKYGAFVAAEVLHRLWEKRDVLFPTVHAAATVQEETSRAFTGATTAAYRVKPTAAIAVDVNHSLDVPGGDKRRFGDAAMGKGPVLTVGVKSSNRLARAIQAAAAQANIAIQLECENGYMGTDADAMPTIRAGVPTLSIGIPLRYMHNTIETAQWSDIDDTVRLLTAFLLGITEEQDFTA